MPSPGFGNNAGVNASKAVVIDTSFLICLVSDNRPSHATAKTYYRYFLENNIAMLLPTVVVAEFAVKQPPEDLPLRNFVVEPFNFEAATTCASLNAAEHRERLSGQGQRDAVKDDFKIIAHAVQSQALYLITDDRDTMAKYCARLQERSLVAFQIVPLWENFEIARVNGTGQTELGLDSNTELGH